MADAVLNLNNAIGEVAAMYAKRQLDLVMSGESDTRVRSAETALILSMIYKVEVAEIYSQLAAEIKSQYIELTSNLP